VSDDLTSPAYRRAGEITLDPVGPPAEETFRTETVPVDGLRPHPRNYRTHPAEQLDHIAASIERHGYYRNVVIARDGTILAGHGVVAAVRRLGRSTVPVVRLDLDPEEPRAIQVLTSDNEIARLAEVDDRALTELLRELTAVGVEELLGTGFDEQQVAALALITRPASEMEDFEAAGEWLGLPGFEPTPRVPQVNVEVQTEEDRAEVLRLLGITTVIKATGPVWKVRWPDEPRRDLLSVQFLREENGDG